MFNVTFWIQFQFEIPKCRSWQENASRIKRVAESVRDQLEESGAVNVATCRPATSCDRRMFGITKISKFLRRNLFFRTNFIFRHDKMREIYKICENQNLGFAISKFAKIEIRVNDQKTSKSVGLRISKRKIYQNWWKINWFQNVSRWKIVFRRVWQVCKIRFFRKIPQPAERRWADDKISKIKCASSRALTVLSSECRKNPAKKHSSNKNRSGCPALPQPAAAWRGPTFERKKSGMAITRELSDEWRFVFHSWVSLWVIAIPEKNVWLDGGDLLHLSQRSSLWVAKFNQIKF